MIRTLHKDGHDLPLLICDICDTWIEGAGEAAAVWKTARNEGDATPVLHVHKRGCHALAEQRLGGRAECSWEEMGTHLLYLVGNTGLTPEQLQEIQSRNDQLGL